MSSDAPLSVKVDVEDVGMLSTQSGGTLTQQQQDLIGTSSSAVIFHVTRDFEMKNYAATPSQTETPLKASTISLTTGASVASPVAASKEAVELGNDPLAFDRIDFTQFGDLDIDVAKAQAALRPTIRQVAKDTPLLMVAVGFSALGGLLFGYDTGIINGVQLMDGWIDTMGLNGLSSSASADLVSWIASSLVLAAAGGALLSAPLSETIGRKWTITLGCGIVTIGAIIQAAANSSNIMILGRVIEGIAIGFLSTVIPMYTSEITPRSVRGVLGTLFQLSITIGILAAFLVNLAFRKASQRWNDWRWSLGTQGALSLVLLCCMFLLPESPRFLIARHRDEEARQVLHRVRKPVVVGRRKRTSVLDTEARSSARESGVHRDDETLHHAADAASAHSTPPLLEAIEEEDVPVSSIELEMREVQAEVAFVERAEKGSSYLDLIRRKDMWLRTSMGICLQFFQQLTGVNAIFYYSSIIFVDIGLDADMATSVTGAVNVAATFIAVYSMDKLGRRSLLLLGAVGMTVCTGIVAILMWSTTPASNTQAGNAIIVFICLFIVNFAYSWGPICWIVPSEVFPIETRSKGMAVSTMANWLANFAIAKAVPSMILPSNLGIGGTFMFFSGFCAIMWFYTALFIHETSGITLERMNNIFGIDTLTQLKKYIATNWKSTFTLTNAEAAKAAPSPEKN